MKNNVRNGAISRTTVLIALLSLLVTALTPPATPLARAQSTDPLTASIEQAVLEAVTELKGTPPEHGSFVEVKRVNANHTWAFGTIVLLAPKDGETQEPATAQSYNMPEGRLWLARHTANEWEAAIDYTSTFNSWLQQSPSDITSDKEKEILGSTGPNFSANGTTTLPPNKLSLPWTPGQRWEFSGGPHGWGGYSRPWSSLDFAKGEGDGRVLAARDGLVYRPCGDGKAYVMIRHEDKWQTDYYHLENIPQFSDGTWIESGRYIGNTGWAVDCGGKAYGPHVHFNIRYNGYHVEWHGQKIGGWTIYEGSRAYEGCAQRGAEVVCAGGLMTNYDTSQRTYDGADKGVVYEGSWRHDTNTDDTAWNTLSSSSTAGSKARFSFTGRRISLIYSMTPTGGSSDIYINGVYKDTISHRAAETRKQVIRTWELGYGTYTFEVRVKGGGTSDVDGLAVNIVPVGPGSYDNTHPQLRYIGYWQHVDSTSRYDVSEAYNDTLSWALDSGPGMRFTFVGDQLTYVYSKAYNRGKAAITIDGVNQGYIDLYSSGVVRQQSTTFSNLGKGVHVIHVTVSGQKNAASSDDAVDVDRLIVR